MKTWLRKNAPWALNTAKRLISLIRALKTIKVEYHDFAEQLAAFFYGRTTMSKHDAKAYGNFFTRKVRSKSIDWLILDVGAHDAWFLNAIRRFCVPGDCHIIAFEPLPSKKEGLLRVGKNFDRFKLIGKALGEVKGDAEITEYGSTGLSSLRSLSDSYSYYAGFNTTIKAKHRVEVSTLDAEILEHDARHIILKIDTQGFEYQVLAGAKSLLKSGRIKYIIIELMTVQKYDGASTYREIFELLHSYGYSLYNINPTYYETDSGRMTEFDAFFELNSPK